MTSLRYAILCCVSSLAVLTFSGQAVSSYPLKYHPNETANLQNSPGVKYGKSSQKMLISRTLPSFTIEVKSVGECGGYKTPKVSVRGRRAQRNNKGSWSSKYNLAAGESRTFQIPEGGVEADSTVVEIELTHKHGSKTCSTETFFYNWLSGQGVMAGTNKTFGSGDSVTVNGIRFSFTFN